MPFAPEQLRLLFRYDRQLPLDVHDAGATVADGLAVERFSFLSTHDQRVPAVLYRPLDADAPLPVVLIGHGAGGSKDNALMAMLFRDWAARGIACLSIDAPYHGERSAGIADPTIIFRRPFTGFDFVVQNVVDGMRAVDWIATRPELDASRVGYCGFSMGAILGVPLVALEPRLRAAVFALGGAGVIHFLAGMAPAERRPDFQLVAEATDPLHYAPLIAPRPVLMVNGTRDSIIPAPLGYALFGALREPKRILWYEGEHGDVPHAQIHEMRIFLEESLRGASAERKTA